MFRFRIVNYDSLTKRIMYYIARDHSNVIRIRWAYADAVTFEKMAKLNEFTSQQRNAGWREF